MSEIFNVFDEKDRLNFMNNEIKYKNNNYCTKEKGKVK